MMKYSSVVAFGVLVLLSANAVDAQNLQTHPPRSDDSVERNELSTLSSVIPFAGAESRTCPTGSGMFTLLGSRAIFTIPQIPPVSKEKAVPTDIDNVLFGDTILKVSTLADRSGKVFQFVGRTCT